MLRLCTLAILSTLAILVCLAACSPPSETKIASAKLPAYGQTKQAVLGAIALTAENGNTLAGQQVNEYEVFIECTSSERIFDLTGQWPAVLGLELMFIIENPSYREHFMARAKEHAARGGIIAITWHARNPLQVCPRGEFYKCSQMQMNNDALARVLDTKTEEYRLWAKDVDAIADVLREMKDLGIAPIFRPYHEMNGDWFWWGQKEEYKALWQMLHQKLNDEYKLNNLVWTWSPDKHSVGVKSYYPGYELVDMVGADLYTGDKYDTMFATAKNNVAGLHPSKHFSFTEIGLLPSQDIFKKISPAYFLLWGGEFINVNWSSEPCDWCNQPEDVAAIYSLKEVLALDELQWPENAKLRFDEEARVKPPVASCPSTLIEMNYHD